MKATAQVHYRTDRWRKDSLERLAEEKGVSIAQLIEAALDATYPMPDKGQVFSQHQVH